MSPSTEASAASPAQPRVYRPRHPERAPTYRLLERHYDSYIRAHEERFEERHGGLRAVVGRSVTQYLDCGRLIGGFARIRCETCRDEHLLAFSCKTRNLCSSCQSKRSRVFGERLRQEIAAPVAHRHVVFTIPKALRCFFENERSLLSRAAYETLRRTMNSAAKAADDEGRAAAPGDTAPGVVASIQTFGSYANFHPHIHALVTEEVFAKDGTFHAVAWPSPEALEEEFRRLLLAALVYAERLTAEFAANLLSWAHSGFSVYAASRVDALDLDGLERLARYVTRPALATGAVSIRDDGRVEVATPPDPATGSASVTMDALEFVHAVVTQIPDARRHLVRYYGAYCHRRRAALREKNGVAGSWRPRTPPGPSRSPPHPIPSRPPSPAPRRRGDDRRGRGCSGGSSKWTRFVVPPAGER